MNVDEFSQAQWRDILDELRLLVVRAGYADWDAAMAETLGEERAEIESRAFDGVPIRQSSHELRRYAEAFRRFLKARSRETLAERRRQLSSLLHTVDGEPVDQIVLSIDGRELPIGEGYDDPDAMIAELGRFLATITGEDDAFWEEGEGDDEPEGER